MNNFLNIKIGFSLIVTLLALLGIFAIDRVDKIALQTEKIYEHPFKVTRSAITIDKDLISMHRYMKDVVLSTNDTELTYAIEQVNKYEIIILKEYERIFKRYLGPDSDIKDSYNAFLQWRPIRDKVIALVVNNQKDKAARITKNEGAKHVEFLNSKVKTLTTFASKKANEFYYETLIYESTTKKVLILLLLILIIISIIISIVTIKNLKSSTKIKDIYLEKLEKLTITDPLTNIYNRRYFDDIFSKELKIMARSDLNLVLMILDIDNFKNYNDIYGHLEGDKVIKEVANDIKSNLRRVDDYVFRIGGEEFAIVMKVKDINTIKSFCENIVNSIIGLKIKHEDNNSLNFVSISLGAGIIDPHLNYSASEIFNIVDMSMYDCKNSGRNQAKIIDIKNKKTF